MKLIKTILISITAILFLLIILFSVQTIDYAINGKTYSEVDKFFEKINTLAENDMCMKNFGDVTKYNTRHDNLPAKMLKTPSPQKLRKLPLKPELYSKAILSCEKYKNDVAAIDIPKNIQADKQTQLKKYVKLNSEVIDLLLSKLDKYKNYNGYMNNEDFSGTVAIQNCKIRINMKLTEIQAKKRFTFEYIFKSIPKKLSLKGNLAKINKISK